MRKKPYCEMVDALKSRLNQNQTNSTLGAMDAEMTLLFFVLLLFVFFGFVHLVASSEKKEGLLGINFINNLS